MPTIDEFGRPEPPRAGAEIDTLLGFLEYQRATLAWKCADLDAAGLSRTVGASSMTLGGILKHLALVEESWFSEDLHGRDPVAPWDAVDWDADRDWEWHSAADDTPEELLALWHGCVERSRADVALALTEGEGEGEGEGLDRLALRTRRDGSRVSLRWILVHMVEEYARHNGHADILREAIDGATGE